ncbi:MAG: flap endonuclease-1 [Candidatus Diapherotrites archaeon]|nr:flap endonuclease-1 [Candidatus Diapherotrites archaeon]
MGTQISDILEKQEIELSFLNGRKIGVDSYNILYQFLSIIRGSDGTPLMDSKGRITSHLTGLFYRTLNLLDAGALPVFVFDGKPNKLKRETTEERNRIRTTAAEKFKTAKEKGDVESARKYAMQSSKLTKEMVEQAKTLLQYMGLPVVQAPSEGEAQIAQMVDKNELFGCVSQDFDSLLFSAKRLLRNVTVSGKRKAPGKDYYYTVKPELIELEKNLSVLGIDRRKLVWIGILVGTDFNQKFPKIGSKTALQLVQKFDSFEDIIKETSHTPDFDYKEIEQIFLNPPFSEDYKIEFKSPNTEKIKEFLCEEHAFSKERVESALKKIEAKLDFSAKQTRLGAWG